MHFPSFTSSILLTAFAAESIQAATQTHPLYHRYVLHRPTSESASTTNTEWRLRGSIHVDSEVDRAWFDDDVSSNHNAALTRIDQLSKPSNGGNGNDRLLYQIAVGSEQENMISVDECILQHSPRNKRFNETLSLYYSEDEVGGLRYETNTMTEGCATLAASKSNWVAGLGHDGTSLTVLVERPKPADEPIFKKQDAQAQPIVISEDGKIVPPPPEKGFLAKYWIYILPVMVVLMMGGSEETGPPGTAGGKPVAGGK